MGFGFGTGKCGYSSEPCFIRYEMGSYLYRLSVLAFAHCVPISAQCVPDFAQRVPDFAQRVLCDCYF